MSEGIFVLVQNTNSSLRSRLQLSHMFVQRICIYGCHLNLRKKVRWSANPVCQEKWRVFKIYIIGSAKLRTILKNANPGFNFLIELTSFILREKSGGSNRKIRLVESTYYII